MFYRYILQRTRVLIPCRSSCMVITARYYYWDVESGFRYQIKFSLKRCLYLFFVSESLFAACFTLKLAVLWLHYLTSHPSNLLAWFWLNTWTTSCVPNSCIPPWIFYSWTNILFRWLLLLDHWNPQILHQYVLVSEVKTSHYFLTFCTS